MPDGNRLIHTDVQPVADHRPGSGQPAESGKVDFAMTPAPIPATQTTHALDPIDANIDHVRGQAGAPLILEYGDYECPYSRGAFRSIERVEAQLSGRVRFAFRHFPLMAIHPHALAASVAAEAAALQGRFWEMHKLLFRRQRELADDDLRRYGVELGLDLERFDRDRYSERTRERVRRDVRSGIASGEVHGTPTLFIDGVVHRGSYDVASLLEALPR